MFLGLVSTWFACLAWYSGSERQQLWQQHWPTAISHSAGLLLFVVSVVLVARNFPLTSAIIACLVAIFTFLPLQTIVSVYHKRYLVWLSVLLVVLSLILTIAGVK